MDLQLLLPLLADFTPLFCLCWRVGASIRYENAKQAGFSSRKKHNRKFFCWNP